MGDPGKEDGLTTPFARTGDPGKGDSLMAWPVEFLDFDLCLFW